MVKVSIVISTYNRAHLLSNVIESALEQTYENIEVLVFDDASTDSTSKILENYKENKKVVYIRKLSNIGIAKSWKEAFFEHASGDWITVLNDDDEFIDKDYIKDSLQLAKKYQDENVVAVFSKAVYYSDGNKINSMYDSFDVFNKGIDLFNGKVFIHTDNGVMYKKEVVKDLELFNDNISTLDVEMLYKLMLVGNFCFLDKETYQHNVHSESVSLVDKKNIDRIFFSTRWIFNVYDFGLKIGIEKKTLEDFKKEKSRGFWNRLVDGIEYNFENYVVYLLEKLPQNESIYLYGTGKGSDYIFSALNNHRKDINILGFIDDFKEGLKYNLPILKLGYINDNPIIITLNRAKVVHRIVNNLRLEKCTNEIYDIMMV